MIDVIPSPEGTPRQSSAEAKRFLTAIGRDQPLLFRVLFDAGGQNGKRGHQPVELTGSFDEHAKDLRRHNDAGFGVFVQVNRSDGNGGRSSNIVDATCLFADFDGVPLENVERLALSPHMTVETSPGKRHFYWRVADIPLAEFSALQKRLIRLFDSDKSIHDLPRIMRLPGFLHLKNPDEPHLVRVLETRDAEPYAFGDFVAALAGAEKAHGITPATERKRLPSTIAAPAAAVSGQVARDLAVAESALRHSIDAGTVDLGERADWVRVGIALKASTGEAGFNLWAELSSEAAGFVGEDDCRKQWDSFKDDLPEQKRLTIATFIANAKYTGWRLDSAPAISAEPDDAGDARGGNGKPDIASIIIEQAAEAGDEHFLSPDGLSYVRYHRKLPDGAEHRMTIRLDSSEYRGVLALRFHGEAVNRAAGKDHINTATGLMEARARAAGTVHPVYLRTAHHDGRVYVSLDVDRGLAAEIDDSKEGWRVVVDPPVRFVAGSRGKLPMPERGGTRELFAKHFNVKDDDLTCTIAFMLGTFQDIEAYPILIAHGEHGAAKSNFADKVLALTDPPLASRKAARFSFSTEERNLHVQAARCSVMFFDNVSTISLEVSDQLCRIATGGASSFRLHNTMDGEQQFAVCRPVVMTCIAVPPVRTDLLSRSLQITVKPVLHRRTERAVWREFDADEAKMVGFLFTAVSAVLRNRAAVDAMVEAHELAAPRMADFAAWVEAAHDVLVLPLGGFCKLINTEQATIQSEAVQGDPVADGLKRYFSRPGAVPLDVTAAELLELLQAEQPLRDWPSVKTIKARLTRIVQGLRDSGIEVVFKYDSHGKRAKFVITANAQFAAADAPADHGDDEPLPF